MADGLHLTSQQAHFCFQIWAFICQSLLPGVCMHVCLNESLIPPYDHSWGYILGQRFRQREDVEIAHLC